VSAASFDPSLFSDWEEVRGFVGDERVATAYLRGSEVHFIVDVAWRCKAIQKDRLITFLKDLLDQAGYLTTRVQRDRYAQARFVRRLGFTKTWSDDNFDYFFLGSISKGKLHDSLRT
jgi:hypothetical protein